MLTELEIDQALEKLEREYRSDREALLRMKRLVSRDILSNSADQPAQQQPEIKTPPKKLPLAANRGKASVPPTKRTRSNRDIVRALIAAAGENFTSVELMDAAKKSGDDEVASLTSGVMSSTLSYMKDSGQLEMVKKGVGNTPATYRLVIPIQQLLNPPRNRGELHSPLLDAIKDGVANMPAITFDRKELYDFLASRNPQIRERFKLDSVGAILNKLANNNDGVRVISRSTTGNLYEKIQ